MDTSDASLESGLSRSECEALDALLATEAERATEQAAKLKASFEAIVEAAELVNTDDEHDPEGTTIAFERAQVAALLAQAEADIEAVAHARQRLADGDYGLCATCSGPVGLERLRALPTATRCVRCA